MVDNIDFVMPDVGNTGVGLGIKYGWGPEGGPAVTIPAAKDGKLILTVKNRSFVVGLSGIQRGCHHGRGV